MQTTIENLLRVRPETFWRLFFDTAYNDGLYQELGFQGYEVLALEREPDGSVRRSLRAAPPLSGPAMLQRALKGVVYYTEEGRYDASRDVWEFVNRTSVAAGTTRVSGSIRVAPHPEGVTHIVVLDVEVSALGLGGMIERAIEKSTRESYRVATAYTNAFAARSGLAV
ncbi:MAG: DUF2505 family protein [Polyangiales bacterium]